MASIEWQKNGSCKIIVSAGYDSSGKKIRQRETITAAEFEGMTQRQREKEALRRSVLFEDKVKNGLVMDGEKITFKEFAERWIKDYAESELAPKTLYENKKMLDNRIIPLIGHLKIALIKPSHLLEFKKRLTQDGIRLDYKYTMAPEFYHLLDKSEVICITDKRTRNRLKEGLNTHKALAEKISSATNISIDKIFKPVIEEKKLSDKTMRNHYSLVSSILMTAVEWQVIPANPCDRVKAPKYTPKEASHYDDEQVEKLMVLLEDAPSKYKTFIHLAVFTGARLGEVSALMWDDLDLKSQTLRIDKARQYIPKIGTFDKDPKSKRSNRTIYLTDAVIDSLMAHKETQIQDLERCGSLWQGSNRIFTTWNGAPILPNTVSQWFGEFLKKNNLPHITFHQLRHTNASIMIANGIDVATISKRLGHAQISTTLNIYTHAFDKANEEASKKLDAALSINSKKSEK